MKTPTLTKNEEGVFMLTFLGGIYRDKTCHVGKIEGHVGILMVHVGKIENHVGKNSAHVGIIIFASENSLSKKPSNKKGCQSYRQHRSRFSSHTKPKENL